VLRQPELANDPRFSSNSRRTESRAALRALIVAGFADLSAEQVVARLEDAQIANARVNTMADVWQHPQLRSRGRWTEVQTPTGAVPALWPPGVPAEFEPRMDPVPRLGEHSDAILAELNYGADQIALLRKVGAI
jgi:itaconate CoA-transferase